MNYRKVNIYGSGGHANVVIETLLSQNRGLASQFDDNQQLVDSSNGKLEPGLKLRADKFEYPHNPYPWLIAIGDIAIRKKLASLLTNNNASSEPFFTNAIHSSAIVSERSSIGDGTVVLAGVVIQTNARLGNHVIVNTRSIIEHDCVVGDFSHIAPGVTLCGNVRVGHSSHVGAGATVIQGITIGDNVMIGAGAVVIRDVADNTTVVGCPASPIKTTTPAQAPAISTSGYLHPIYAKSFAEFGTPVQLPNSGAWILEREIPGNKNYRDAMAIYPFLCCESWEDLRADLDQIKHLVSLTVVPEPFGKHSPELLKELFPDCCNQNYKISPVADLQKPFEEFVSKKRRKAAIKALDKLTIEVVDDPANELEEFSGLYEQLIRRHDIRGMRAFSRTAFRGMLQTPGLVYIRAKFNNKTIGVQTWMIQGDAAYAHLAAYDEQLGFKMYAPSALYWFSYPFFAERVRWLFYGGSAAGADSGDQQRLVNFKSNWGSEGLPVYLCGRIFQPDAYAELSKESSYPESGYFPAYRQGEFI